jgi:hypothetical protein
MCAYLCVLSSANSLAAAKEDLECQVAELRTAAEDQASQFYEMTDEIEVVRCG